MSLQDFSTTYLLPDSVKLKLEKGGVKNSLIIDRLGPPKYADLGLTGIERIYLEVAVDQWRQGIVLGPAPDSCASASNITMGEQVVPQNTQHQNPPTDS